MSVHLSLDENQPKDKDGKEYRHYSADCTVLKASGQKVKHNVPNTKALQARTVRCPNPSKEEKGGCWELYEMAQAAKKTRGGTRASKAAKQPPKAQGGKAGNIAAKAAAARKKKDTKPAESKPAEQPAAAAVTA